jgi:hypothetical protein
MQLNDIVIPGSPSNFITKRLHHLDTEKFFVASYDCKNKINVNRSYISTYPVRVFPFQPSVTTGGGSSRRKPAVFIFTCDLGKISIYTANSISHFPIEQRTGSSHLFGGTKNKQYAEYGI